MRITCTRRVTQVLWLLVAIFGSAACLGDSRRTDGSSKRGVPEGVYCYRNLATGGCQCGLENRSLGADEELAEDCDETPDGSVCCYDVDADGATTSCECQVPYCKQDTDTGNCGCGFSYYAPIIGQVADTEVDVASCDAVTCCERDAECGCVHVSNIACADGFAPVDSCSMPVTRTCSSRSASSCQGLEWNG